MKISTFLFAFFLLTGVSYCTAQIWEPLGPIGSETYNLKTSAWGGGTGQIHSFAFIQTESNPDKFNWYAGSPWGGLWFSNNEGKIWLDANTSLQNIAGVCSVSDIATDEKTLYVATGRPTSEDKLDAPSIPCTGIFKSIDYGKTFQKTLLQFPFEENIHCSKIAVNLFNNTLFAVTTKGVFSNDKGENKKWKKVFNNTLLFTAIVSPNFQKNKTIYVSGDAIYYSQKGGKKGSFKTFAKTFDALLPTNFKNRNINVDAVNTNGVDNIYAAVFQDGSYYFLFFDGNKWNLKNNPQLYGIFIPTPDRIKLAANTTKEGEVFAGPTYVCKSNDFGNSWKMAAQYCQPGSQYDPLNAHGDIHSIAYIPKTNDVLIGTDGGIFRHRNAANKTEELNNGLNISQTLGMSSNPTNSKKILIGKQDTGIDIFDGENWKNMEGGDGFSINWDPNDSNAFYGMGGELKQFNNDFTLDSRTAYPCFKNDQALYAKVVAEPTDPKKLFWGGSSIYESTNGGESWCKIYQYHSTNNQPVDFNSQLSAISISHDSTNNTTVVYAGNFGFWQGCLSQMVRGDLKNISSCSTDCGENFCSTCWQKIKLPHEDLEFIEATKYSISGIISNKNNPEEVWICYYHNVLKDADYSVFKSTDGGKNWKAEDKGLPPFINPTTLVKDDASGVFYLGTSTGIFVNKNNGEGWISYSENLPKSFVKVLEIIPSIKKIRAALYGRGVWENKLF